MHHAFLYISVRLPCENAYFHVLWRTWTQEHDFLSFFWTSVSTPEKIADGICTNWRRWNKRDKVLSSATSLFEWRFRSRCRRCCLSSQKTEEMPCLGSRSSLTFSIHTWSHCIQQIYQLNWIPRYVTSQSNVHVRPPTFPKLTLNDAALNSVECVHFGSIKREDYIFIQKLLKINALGRLKMLFQRACPWTPIAASAFGVCNWTPPPSPPQ